MKVLKILFFFLALLAFSLIFTTANIVSKSVTVGNLDISYSTDYPENILEIRRSSLNIEVEVIFPAGSSSIEFLVFSFGLKITNSPPTIKTANNNVYGVNKSALTYEGDRVSFSYDVQIDLDSMSLEDGTIYFTPFLEYRGSYDGTTIDMTYTFLPSFSPGEKFQNSDSGNETNWFNYFLVGGGGIIVISGIALYLKNSQGKSRKD